MVLLTKLCGRGDIPAWKKKMEEAGDPPVHLVNGDSTTADSQSDEDSSQDEGAGVGEEYVLLPQDPSDDETTMSNGHDRPSSPTFSTREWPATAASSNVRELPDGTRPPVLAQESREQPRIGNELADTRESSVESVDSAAERLATFSTTAAGHPPQDTTPAASHTHQLQDSKFSFVFTKL